MEESGSAGKQGEGKSWMQRRMGKRGKGGSIAGKQEFGGGVSREVEMEGDRKWGKSGGSWRGLAADGGGWWGERREISPEREMQMLGMEMEVEMMAARRSGGGGGGGLRTAASR